MPTPTNDAGFLNVLQTAIVLHPFVLIIYVAKFCTLRLIRDNDVIQPSLTHPCSNGLNFFGGQFV